MIDIKYLRRLQALRQHYWNLCDTAQEAQDWESVNHWHAMAMGISEAISALQNYDMVNLIIDRIEEKLAAEGKAL